MDSYKSFAALSNFVRRTTTSNFSLLTSHCIYKAGLIPMRHRIFWNMVTGELVTGINY